MIGCGDEDRVYLFGPFYVNRALLWSTPLTFGFELAVFRNGVITSKTTLLRTSLLAEEKERKHLPYPLKNAFVCKWKWQTTTPNSMERGSVYFSSCKNLWLFRRRRFHR